MAPTSDERREVAEELRALDVFDLGDAGNVIDTSDESGALFGRILAVANDYRPGLHYATSHFVARDAVDLFADLIDPTCHLLPSSDGGFGCDRCYTWFPSMKEKTNYCPECGARVVER